jgi:hypothetical protein
VLCGGIPGAGDEGDEDSEDDGDYEAGEESSVDEEFGSDDSDDNGEGENTKKRKKKGSDESGSGSGSGSDSVRDQSLAVFLQPFHGTHLFTYRVTQHTVERHTH